jgi:acid phosphatase type 7
MLSCSLLAIMITALSGFSGPRFLHDGPDPLAHWILNSHNIEGNQLKARLGPNAQFTGSPKVDAGPPAESVSFDGGKFHGVVAEEFSLVKQYLPTKAMTVEAWVSIHEPEPWGGILGVIQDNGNDEKGWILGYDDKSFYFGLSTRGADDGNGKMSYLKGKSRYECNRLYHVVAVYDGQLMQLYVNGKLDSETKEQSGDILYPETAPLVIGAYRDQDEFNPLQGRIKEVALFDLAAKEKWVTKQFQNQAELTAHNSPVPAKKLEFAVKPFLQYGTESGMTVVWETTVETRGTLFWGEVSACRNQVAQESNGFIHEIRIEGLKPDTQYFYRVKSEAGNEAIDSEASTFQTACGKGRPIAFAVISDTQDNPVVAGKLSELAWAQRPQFVILPGDLVGSGRKKSDWVEEFFPSLNPLISRVPLYSVLGNHEENAEHYFNYMALPKPEYYYSFTYGDAEFFMIDSNRNVDPGSEQYKWLDQALSKSTATWKFASHHHPPFSSDEDDYGDLWKTNRGTQGDERIRQLVPLYEKHGVDIVWTGHIHSYERTWPLRRKRSVEVGGTIYMITGGGGGSLETPGPYRPFFQNIVRRGHHYVMVHINGETLELRSFDLDDRLFDTVKIQKSRASE